MATGYVIFDLATLYGTADFRPGASLDRSDKGALELGLAAMLLKSLEADERLAASDSCSNPNDPPDILFTVDGHTKGLELAELLPENRLERDAILKRAKRKVLSRMRVGEKTKDWVVTITLVDDYAIRIDLPRDWEAVLATTLDSFFAQVTQEARTRAKIPVPQDLRAYVRSMTADPCDLSGDPRVGNRTEPLITFSAQHTNVIPDRQFPQIIDEIVHRKELHDLTVPTWLLLWSNHYAFGPLCDQLVQHIDQYLTEHPSKYARVFYLHLHFAGCITEFLPDTETQG